MDGATDLFQGLNQNTQQLIHSVAGWLLGSKTLEVVKKLIGEIAINNCWRNSSGKLITKAAKILEVSEVTGLTTQVKGLSKKIDSLSLPKSATIMACDTCGGGQTLTD